ncbi:MAG: tetratricopeptide repeat protein [Pseudomonadota bacterium]
MNRVTATLLALLIAISAVACGGSTEKKLKFCKTGDALYQKGDYVKAALEFKNALQVDPDYEPAHYQLGLCYYRQASWQQAFKHLQRAVELNPKHNEAQLKLGQLFLLGGRPTEAAVRAKVVLKRQPKNVEALTLHASALASLKKTAEAMELVSQARRLDPTFSPAVMLASRLHEAQGDRQAAEATLREGLKRNPKDTSLWMALASFCAQQKRFPEAESSLRALIALKPDSISYRLQLVRLLAVTGKAGQAEAELRGLIKAKPKESNLRLALAELMLNQRNFAAAENALQEGIRTMPEEARLHFTLATVYLLQGKTQAAMDYYARYIKEHADDPEAVMARDRLADINLQRGKTAEALKLANESIAANAKDLEAHFIKGKALLATGDGPGAVAEFRLIEHDQPKNPEAHLWLAKAHWAGGSKELAKEAMIKAAKMDPSYREAALLLVRLYVSEKAYGRARSALASYTGPKEDPEILLAGGDVRAAGGDVAGAERAYRQVAEKFPKPPVGWLRLGALYESQRKYGPAQDAMEKVLSLSPGMPVAAVAVTDMSLRQRQPRRAIAVMDRQIKLAPQQPLFYFLRGRLRAADTDFTGAESDFRQTINLKPDWPEPWSALASLYVTKYGAREALARFEAQNNAPGGTLNGMLTGLLKEQVKDYNGAIEVYKKILKVSPDNTVAANSLAFLYAEIRPTAPNLEEALKLASRVYQKNPNDANMTDTLAWVYHRRGEDGKALEMLNGCLEQVPNQPYFNYHLGAVCLAMGDKARAKTALQKALGSPSDFLGRQEATRLLAGLK